jgi:PAS domain S-box-containing protein
LDVTQLTPQDIPDLESVISTAELERRPSRPPDYAAENRALVALAQEMAVSPNKVLEKLVETALTLCHAHSAGISMLDDERKTFRWIAIAGRWADRLGGATPRNFSPSGTVLDRDVSLLVSHPERHFTYLAAVTPLIDEGLLIPFHLGGEAVATIWVVAHDDSCRFDMEDLRLMTNLGNFAAAAYQTHITEHKRTEETLRDSDEQYQLVVETASDAIISIDESSQIVFANPATERIFGYESSELIGQPLTMLMPDGIRARHETGLRRYLATGQRHVNWGGAELLGRRKGGEEFPIEVAFGEVARKDQRRFTGCVRDISERKRAEAIRTAQVCQALVRADVNLAFARGDNLRAILQACAESVARHLDVACARVWTLDPDHEVLELAASAGTDAHVDGAQSHVPLGQLEVGLIAAERTPLLTNDLLNEPRIGAETRAGSQGILAFAGHPLIVEDRVVGVIAMFSKNSLGANTIDVLGSVADAIAHGIELKRAEDALRLTQTELARVARFTTVAALSASIAHEVKQPLAAIITNAGACLRLLAPDKLDLEETRKALASIIRDGQRAVDVVGRVRALLKKSAVEKTPLDLGELTRETLLLVQPDVTAHHIVLRTSLPDDLPPILGDRIQLQQVVLNLITNSIEAMRDVADRSRELMVSAHRHKVSAGDGVLVAVEDTGVGLEQANVERLFDALYTTKPDGLGMGLSISRSIVEAYQGRLWGTPNAGHGATFQFVLPAWGDFDVVNVDMSRQ